VSLPSVKGSFSFNIEFLESEPSFITTSAQTGDLVEEIVLLQLESYVRERRKKYQSNFEGSSLRF